MTNTSSAPTSKYVIHAKFEVNGIVEKPDVIGAIFGQTEGLFGSDLDLRELQKTNRVGRIEVDMKTEHNKTLGTITVSSSLDKAATAILAAAIESVDRVGPCEARITVEKIEDVRESKRRHIIRRAKELLKKWSYESVPETEEIIKDIAESLKPAEVSFYGPERLPAGPDVTAAPELIVVEGRADVINLLRCGIRNVVAIEGARVPETIVRLSRHKAITLFLDGDRAGDLILKELLGVVEIKHVARAPPGKEVEELTCKEIHAALRERLPVSEVKIRQARTPMPPSVIDAIGRLRGTLEAELFDEKLNLLARLPVSELAERLPGMEGVSVLVFDGIVTQRVVDIAAGKGVKTLIGDRLSENLKRPNHVKVLTFDEVAPLTH